VNEMFWVTVFSLLGAMLLFLVWVLCRAAAMAEVEERAQEWEG
jgi:hypothetical protein